MKFRIAILFGTLCASLCGTAAAIFSKPYSTFDTDADDWTVVDLTYGAVGSPPTVLGTYNPTWSNSGGNPDGHIYIADPSMNVFYWSAPDKFLGNQSYRYGSSLKFDLKAELGTFVFNQEDVVLVGAGRTLVFDAPVVPGGSAYQSYTVGLTETGWRLGSLSGPAVSQADMQTVLGNLEKLYIRGEFRGTESDIGRLDNVKMQHLKQVTYSRFYVNDRGWKVVDLRYPAVGSPPTVLGTYTPNWSGSGGNPDGHIWITDPSMNVFYWSAPDEFLGNRSSSYGASLSFDLRSVLGTFVFNQEDVVLVGGGLSLVFDAPVVPDGAWRNYTVGLTETGWRRGSLTGPAASQADMQSVLADLQNIYIRGEFRGDVTDIGSLDNVILYYIATCAPAPISESVGVPGDFNDDGEVNGADYLVWRRNVGTENALANDPIGGTIGTDHYNLWREHFGNVAGGDALANEPVPVPEPATLAILLGALSVVLHRRRPVKTPTRES